MIKAIETKYKGYRFRSRLEARWAVFFDAAGLRWRYEAEGFQVGNEYYLPDFDIEDVGLVEIKPPGDLSEQEERKMFDFALIKHMAILRGSPWPGEFDVIMPHAGDDSFRTTSEMWLQCPLCGRVQINSSHQSSSRESSIYCWPCDQRADPISGFTPDDSVHFHKGDVCFPDTMRLVTPLIQEAFNAARSARFEHGETPVIYGR